MLYEDLIAYTVGFMVLLSLKGALADTSESGIPLSIKRSPQCGAIINSIRDVVHCRSLGKISACTIALHSAGLPAQVMRGK